MPTAWRWTWNCWESLGWLFQGSQSKDKEVRIFPFLQSRRSCCTCEDANISHGATQAQLTWSAVWYVWEERFQRLGYDCLMIRYLTDIISQGSEKLNHDWIGEKCTLSISLLNIFYDTWTFFVIKLHRCIDLPKSDMILISSLFGSLKLWAHSYRMKPFNSSYFDI